MKTRLLLTSTALIVALTCATLSHAQYAHNVIRVIIQSRIQPTHITFTMPHIVQ